MINKFNPYVRLAFFKMGKQQGQQCAGNEGRAHYAHPARTQAAEISRVFFHQQKFVKGLLRQRIKLAPVGRERHKARSAVKQGHPDLRLQILDKIAYGALGDMQ